LAQRRCPRQRVGERHVNARETGGDRVGHSSARSDRTGSLGRRAPGSTGGLVARAFTGIFVGSRGGDGYAIGFALDRATAPARRPPWRAMSMDSHASGLMHRRWGPRCP
jgi:hypothetical protein